MTACLLQYLGCFVDVFSERVAIKYCNQVLQSRCGTCVYTWLCLAHMALPFSAHFCTFLHMSAHLCTFMHIYAHSCIGYALQIHNCHRQYRRHHCPPCCTIELAHAPTLMHRRNTSSTTMVSTSTCTPSSPDALPVHLMRYGFKAKYMTKKNRMMKKLTIKCDIWRPSQRRY